MTTNTQLNTEKTITLTFCETCSDDGYNLCRCEITCQSTNHVRCYDYGNTQPILWQCPLCTKWLCYEDGGDDEYHNICDSCVTLLKRNARIK
jgi:hypothetical protein